MNALQRKLLAWYAVHGRAALPWRLTRDPYRILVSEFMLQQTQVDRVVPKYKDFSRRFGSFRALATASTADVLRAWKGLGYNSRAIRLQRVAQIVCERFGSALPRDVETLRLLPGVGAYTAAALRAFAFDEDDVALDTNVRRVTHRLLYGLEHPRKVALGEIDRQARAMVPAGRAHDWNSALMDLGATVCTARSPNCFDCPVAAACKAGPVDVRELERLRARHAPKRSPQESIPFAQTQRFARGRIVDRLRELPPGSKISLLDLHHELREILPSHALGVMEKTLQTLERDGIVRRHGESVALTE